MSYTEVQISIAMELGSLRSIECGIISVSMYLGLFAYTVLSTISCLYYINNNNNNNNNNCDLYSA